MFSRKLKTGYFILEGLNSFGTVYYFFYFYFFMQKAFGFGNKANLALAALNGAIYALSALGGGKFAQRFGYFTALKLGYSIMLVALAAGTQVGSANGQIAVMAVTIFGLCFVWPTLEALISEGETREGIQHMIGVYNVVWAATAASAYFSGGAMLDLLGLKSLFYVPMAIMIAQLALTLRLESSAGPVTNAPDDAQPAAAKLLERQPAARAKSFLRMAWLANPFAYIANNTMIALMPGVAMTLGLSTTLAGFCCSVWCFSRLGAFVGLWLWTGWHYRFRWLLSCYVALIATFAVILMVPNLAAVVLAQVAFGAAMGLIYYSSLFYSMDIGETKGEHGGIHEAAIGLGNFAGPAVGAASLYCLPNCANSGALAVSGLLVLGLGGLVVIWRKG